MAEKPSTRAQALAIAAEAVADVLFLAGCAMVVGGAWAIYEPAGWIVGGLACAGFAFMLSRGA